MDFLYIVHSYFALFISSVKNFLIFQNFLDKRLLIIIIFYTSYKYLVEEVVAELLEFTL